MSDGRPARGVGPQLERESELLRHELPPVVARGLAELVILIVLLVAAFVLFVKLPDSVTGRFVLRGEGGSDPVNAEAAGVVDAVAAHVGMAVTEGETLLVIRSDELRRLAAERLERMTKLAEAQRELAALAGDGDAASETSELQARVVRLEREVAAAREVREQSRVLQDALVAEARSDAARLGDVVAARAARAAALEALVQQREKLAAEGVVSQQDVLVRRGDYEDARAEHEESRRDHARVRSSIARLEADRLLSLARQEEAVARLEGQLAEARAARDAAYIAARAHVAEAEEQIAALNRVLATVDGDRLAVVAPYDGIVLELDVERAGVSVERGQRLAVLARTQGPLHARIDVPESEAARVVPGQGVRLMIDAYPYARHGIVAATLSWVSPEPVDGKVTAIADLAEESVLVDGLPRPLQGGLGGWARIDIGRSTVLEYILEPLSQLRQRLRSAPEGVPRAPLRAGPRPATAEPEPQAEPASGADAEAPADARQP